MSRRIFFVSASICAIALASNLSKTSNAHAQTSPTLTANRAFTQFAGMTAGLAESFYDFYSCPAAAYRSSPANEAEPAWWVWSYTAELGCGLSIGVGSSFMSDNGKTQEVNSAGTQTNLYYPSGTGAFFDIQGSWMVPVTALPVPQIGGTSNIPIAIGPFIQANLGGQVPAVTPYGSYALGTETKTNFVLGGEVEGIIGPKWAVYSFAGWLDGRQTNFINFASGYMSQTHWVPGIAFGGGVEVADQNVPGLIVFGQIEAQNYNQTTTPGGIASPGFTYNMRQTGVLFTGGVKVTPRLAKDFLP